MATITCAFCKGKGKDPFKLLSRFATCEVCNGTGRVKVDEPVIKCAFCKGSGIHPHSRITCVVCNGKGSVTQKGNKEECSACHGDGHIQGNGNFPCNVCAGRGVIQKGVEAYGKYSG